MHVAKLAHISLVLRLLHERRERKLGRYRWAGWFCTRVDTLLWAMVAVAVFLFGGLHLLERRQRRRREEWRRGG